MDCFHDFCLACDRESTAGPYCTQACRLADLEKATSSTPSSPTTMSAPTQGDASWTSSRFGSGSGYILPQDYKFPDTTLDKPRSNAQQDTLSKSSSPSSRTPTQPKRQDTLDTQRSLTPSSSRTSLSSNASHSNSNSMSEQAKQELQEYFSAFHQTNAAKRRQSTW